ncbi:MAG: 50S ribosomal protein L22 [Parvularcula sp.]|jgi:large subunit ribosomal protein L22|nr:50S ribosomal protein L22 [Parvularcula sp.]
MGQIKNPSRREENQAIAKGRMIKTSPQKMNLVAQSIRGKKVEQAKNELLFSRKRVAREVLSVLESAISNAENYHDLDIDALVVEEAFVGKNLVMKRFRPRARGRVGRIKKPFAEITIKLREKETA